jgi:hypothetical protein
MDLDERIKTVASGVSVAEAVQAYIDGAADADESDGGALEELRATIEVMFLMAAVDGDVSEVELNQLRASVEAIVDIQAVRGLALDELVEQLRERLAAEGWKRRLTEAAARIHTEEGKAFAFRLAAAVAFIDDFVAHAEAAAIDSLANALDLPRHVAEELLRDVHETLFPDRF